ncbi:MAG: 50S ribosomal protein L29 [Planctomycetota bacterium]
MNKTRDIREMSDEQIRLVWKDASESLFRLKLQAQAEKLAAPTEVRKNRRTIARCQTILAERGSVVSAAVGADGTVAPEAAVATRRRSKKRTQSGK